MSQTVVTSLLLLTLFSVVTSAQEWDPWKPWSNCVYERMTECGEGKKYRERSCQKGQCEGEWQEKDVCFGPPCSTDDPLATWTLWSEWTACTAPSCHVDGTRNRWRECRGTPCPADKIESESDTCRLSPPCKSDGVWSRWSVWSPCSATCGQGYQSRERSCTGVQHGGDLCSGPDYQTKACIANQPICYRAASWGPWNSWRVEYPGAEGQPPCRERMRECEKPYPLDPDKTECGHSNTQRENCG